MRLNGKTALITGAGSGYGAEMARRFRAEGARVACVDLNLDAARQVAAEAGNGAAIAVQCDVADGPSVAAMVKEVDAQFGGFDVLINNAAITQHPSRTGRTPEAEVDRLFAINVKSLYHMAAHALPVLRRVGGGSVINIASVTALRPRPGMTWYNATKAAVISITQSMAGEFAPDRIRVNAIAPAVGRTPMFSEMFKDEAEADAAHDRLVTTIPLGRLCRPTDIAAAAVYLSSDEAEYVTGIIMPIDGGRLVG
ncbi:SDR family NAD(P)-dependent oxidoreductase [Bosea caraganae]|uniref:SDR family NAD(P)-dependent oxidoreductase n=1 Tax=Bosea caraganae TaxID=2763117 RepID=A0A370LCY4_9HYPH|nr:SDR family oxidoreductase [Bosea caraganae]RDJ27803.1 SDR family NAD(P)-dependent oxidoreductase [Bosea caraganae]RDJ29816.1 SDR family NAD(P)-dependent oxidoreductase [Bosea caraganae]